MSDPIAIIASAAATINDRFPGLRQQGNTAWIEKVVYLASLSDPRIGHSTSHGDGNKRRNECGIRHGADVIGGKQSYDAVSLFQINPAAGDPMRPSPLVNDGTGTPRFDFWSPATPVDIGMPVTLPVTPPPAPARALPSYNALGDDAFFVAKVGAFVEAEMAASPEGRMNAGSASWIARAVHGILASYLQHGDLREADAVAKKVRNELRAVLGRGPL